jgi:hypothetical protein
MKRIAAGVLLLSVVACQSAVEGALGSPVGNYSLTAVDGSALPFKSGTTITVRGTIDLKSSGDYTLTQADSATTGSVANTSLSGTWSMNENALVLVPSGASLELGIATIDTLKITRGGHQNLYVRH